MSKHSGQRVIGRTGEGFLEDRFPYCGRWSCEECWRRKLYAVAKATRIYLRVYDFDEIWVGQLAPNEWNAAKKWRQRHKDQGVMALVTGYRDTGDKGVLATHNISPAWEALQPCDLNTAVYSWVGLGLQYRPKRITSDWPIDLPPADGDWVTTIEDDVLRKLYPILNDRYGYSRTKPITDPLFTQRVYTAYKDLVQTDSDYLSGGGD